MHESLHPAGEQLPGRLAWRGLAVLAQPACRCVRTAPIIIEKYLARTSRRATSAIAKFEKALETDFAKRPAKREV
jgi:hypothetical protein